MGDLIQHMLGGKLTLWTKSSGIYFDPQLRIIMSSIGLQPKGSNSRRLHQYPAPLALNSGDNHVAASVDPSARST